jgi:hypothetical protein
MDTTETMPEPGDIGRPGSWTVHSTDRSGTTRVDGRLLGAGSSYKTEHRNHPGRPSGSGCAACRWTEIRVFRDDTGSAEVPRYLVVKHGRSNVPGEKDFVSFAWATGPNQAVLEAASRPRGAGGSIGAPTLTRAALAALGQASYLDPAIREAFAPLAVR